MLWHLYMYDLLSDHKRKVVLACLRLLLPRENALQPISELSFVMCQNESSWENIASPACSFSCKSNLFSG